MYLENLNAYLEKLKEFRSRIVEIEREYHKYHRELVEALPIEVGDILRYENGETFRLDSIRVSEHFSDLYYGVPKKEYVLFFTDGRRKLKSGKWSAGNSHINIYEVVERNGKPFHIEKPERLKNYD